MNTSVFIRLAIGVALLTVVVAAIGPETITAHWARLDLRWLTPAAGLYGGSLLLRGIRMGLLLQRPRDAWTAVVAASTLGWSLNNVLPFRLGDVVRLGLLKLRTGVPLPSLLLSAGAERALDVALLGALVGMAALPHVAGGHTAAAISIGVLVWTGLSFAGLRLMRLSGRRAALTLGATAQAWGLQLLEYACFFRAFGLDPDPGLLLTPFALFMLTFSVNFVPGQLGTYEALFVAIFAVAGAGAPDALAAVALATHLVNAALLSAFGGIGYLHLASGAAERFEVRRLIRPVGRAT